MFLLLIIARTLCFRPYACKKDGCVAKFNQSSSLARHLKSHNKINKLKINPENEKVPPKVQKKISYIIPELLAIKETPAESTPSCDVDSNVRSQHEHVTTQNQLSYSVPQQSLLPEALNPMNLINNSTTPNYNPIPSHSASSLLLPLPSHHDSSQMPDHQMHHFSNFDNTTYLPPTPVNIGLTNSFNFIMGGLDFSKNSLNGEPTYIDY